MKTLHCSDTGFECQRVIRAKSVAEVLNQAAEHARTVHGVEVTSEMAAQLKSLIKEEEEPKQESESSMGSINIHPINGQKKTFGKI